MSSDSSTKQVLKESQRNRHFMQCIPWVLFKASQHMPQISWASCIFHILNSLNSFHPARIMTLGLAPLLFTLFFNTAQAGTVASSTFFCQLKDTQHTSSISCYKITTLVSCRTMFIIVELKTKHEIAILCWWWGKPYFYVPQDLGVQVLPASGDTRSLL